MEASLEKKAQAWLNSQIDNETQAAINQMLEAANKTELTEAFYKDLEFGTGGLRGIMGVGSNRMNRYTVGMATQGLANYLKQSFAHLDQISVVVAHDSRNNSPYFAKVTAQVFSANGIKVYFFESLRPTPELSFAIRQLGCQSGVVLTASHNPKEYNGYKAYWEDGAQLTPPHDQNVMDQVKAIDGIDAIQFNENPALIETIGQAMDQKYLEAIETLSLSKEAIRLQHDLKIVFTPIHGTGITLVPPILERLGFTAVHVVEEQSQPNGNFPTVKYPNPEEADAMHMAMEKAKEIDAELVMATDPDSDRVGIGVKNHHGQWQLLNGNQTGALLMYYLLKRRQELGQLHPTEYIVKTIVTTNLIDDMAAQLGVACYNTLTGFKYIAALIKELEQGHSFVAGCEESYGYLIGDFVRDKDAISACALIAEMMAWAKNQGMGPFDLLISLYEQFGFYKEKLISVTKKGKEGAEQIQQMMANLRSQPPKALGGSAVTHMLDYKASQQTDLATGKVSKLDFPESNVLQFLTADGSKISARPSGTEPKIKFYFSVKGTLENAAQFDQVSQALDQKLDSIIDSLPING